MAMGKLVCRSCFMLDEPAATLGSVGYVLWFVWLGISIVSCAHSAETGAIVTVALLALTFFATRVIGRRLVCASCGSGQLVSVASPAGLQILRDHGDDIRAAQQLLQAAAEGQAEASAAAQREAERRRRTVLDAKIAEAAGAKRTRPCPGCGRPMNRGETGALYCQPCGQYIVQP